MFTLLHTLGLLQLIIIPMGIQVMAFFSRHSAHIELRGPGGHLGRHGLSAARVVSLSEARSGASAGVDDRTGGGCRSLIRGGGCGNPIGGSRGFRDLGSDVILDASDVAGPSIESLSPGDRTPSGTSVSGPTAAPGAPTSREIVVVVAGTVINHGFVPSPRTVVPGPGSDSGCQLHSPNL